MGEGGGNPRSKNDGADSGSCDRHGSRHVCRGLEDRGIVRGSGGDREHPDVGCGNPGSTK